MFDPVSVPTNYDDHLEHGTLERKRSISSETDVVPLAHRPYPTPQMYPNPHMYPTTAPRGGFGQFQSADPWQQQIAY
jgi:hypothetical protein